jgi:hypothetical protein
LTTTTTTTTRLATPLSTTSSTATTTQGDYNNTDHFYDGSSLTKGLHDLKSDDCCCRDAATHPFNPTQWAMLVTVLRGHNIFWELLFPSSLSSFSVLLHTPTFLLGRGCPIASLVYDDWHPKGVQ